MLNKKIIYQIYPSSFNDTTNIGIGDLNGITEKMEYLKSLSIDYLWISPFYKTPFKDNGYDISDYYKVDPKFGTKKDFLRLINKANKNNIKVMIDLIFNHTSIEHEWFKKWISGDKEYKDFYISKYSCGNPPNNWKSKFGGSAWKEYKKNYWYLCLFDKTQADLNWENKHVRKKLFEVIDYYIKLGVKGFRFDVINLISKNNYANDMAGDGRKFYTNGKNFHKWMKELRTFFPLDNDFLTIGELSSTDIENTIKCTNKDKRELDCAFIFYHLKVDYDKNNKFVFKEPDITLLNNILRKWFENIYEKGSIVGFLNNHDQPRSISRFIDKKYYLKGSKMLYALTSLLPGNTCIFQGEEIRMENGDFESIDDYRDIETINYLKTNNYKKIIPKGVIQKSRDNSRTPMQWNNSLNSGFTKGTPWIKVNNNYKEINVEIQDNDKDSTLNFYREWNKFIKNDNVINFGDLKFENIIDKVISYYRILENIKYLCVFNLGSNEITYKFKNNILKSNYNNIKNNMLQPYQFIIFKIQGDK